jgi:hypothetical protein
MNIIKWAANNEIPDSEKKRIIKNADTSDLIKTAALLYEERGYP